MTQVQTGSIIDKLRDILGESQKIVYLVGAGVSMEKPSKLPSAIDFSRSLLKYMVPPEEVEKIMAIKELRYEMIVDRVSAFIDRDLKFLDFLGLKTQFNLIHLLLAKQMKDGKCVITTNFDFLIEYALLSIIDPNSRDKILPIITKEDYLNYPSEERIQGTYPLIKIHGSKRNIITDIDTTPSLVTTITSLGKNREEGETFSIESFKKPLIHSVLRNSTLIIMGYSGRDDFDITPLLTEYKDLKSLIWIEHQVDNDTGIQFTDYSLVLNEEMKKGLTKDEKRVNQEESFIDRFLFNLCKLGIYRVYKIKGNTKTIIKNEFWPIFYPTELVDEKDKEIFGNALSVASASHTTDKSKNLTEFEHFIDEFYQNIKPNKKYSIAARIYSDLSRDDEVMRVCEQALPIVRSSNDFEELSILLNDIGLVFMNHGDLDKALQYFEESLVNIRKLGITVMEGFRFSEIGLIYKKRNELDKALQYYNQAKEILEKYNELGGLTIVYNNIGALYLQKEEIDLALENMQKALKLAEQIGDLQRKATRLSNIATIYLEYKHEPQKAMKYTKEALSIDEQIGDNNSIIVVLNNLAQNYEEIGDKQLAIQTYLKSIELAERTQSILNLSPSYSNLSFVYETLNEMEKAIDYMRKAIAIDDKMQFKKGKMENLWRLGKLYIKTEDPKSLSTLNSALTLARELNDNRVANEVLYEIATFFYDLEDFQQALNYYTKAIEPASIMNKMEDVIIYYRNIGSCYEKMEDFPKAMESYNKALDNSRKFNLDKEIACSYQSIGYLYKLMGDNEIAIQNFEKSIFLAKQLNDYSLIFDISCDLAHIYYNLDDYEKAYSFFGSAVEAGSKTDRFEDVGLNCMNMATCKENLQDRLGAINCYKMAKDWYIRADNKVEVYRATKAVANHYYRLNENDLAFQSYITALSFAKEIDESIDISYCLYQLGEISYIKGEYDKAERFYIDSVDPSLNLEENDEFALTLKNIALCNENLNILKKSLDFYKKALAIYSRLDNKEEVGTISNTISQIEKRLRANKIDST